jgi:hypothetical protein
VKAPKIEPGAVITRTSEIPFVSLDEDMLAMDESAGKCYSLNVSAARVWDAIASPTSVGSVCESLCKEFAVDPETCLADVSELLFAMREAGLVELGHVARD